MATYEEVREVLVEHLGLKSEMIKLDSKLSEDLGADSVDALEIAASLEEKFGTKLSDDEIAQLKHVSDIVTIVNQKLNANQGKI